VDLTHTVNSQEALRVINDPDHGMTHEGVYRHDNVYEAD